MVPFYNFKFKRQVIIVCNNITSILKKIITFTIKWVRIYNRSITTSTVVI